MTSLLEQAENRVAKHRDEQQQFETENQRKVLEIAIRDSIGEPNPTDVSDLSAAIEAGDIDRNRYEQLRSDVQRLIKRQSVYIHESQRQANRSGERLRLLEQVYLAEQNLKRWKREISSLDDSSSQAARALNDINQIRSRQRILFDESGDPRPELSVLISRAVVERQASKADADETFKANQQKEHKGWRIRNGLDERPKPSSPPAKQQPTNAGPSIPGVEQPTTPEA